LRTGIFLGLKSHLEETVTLLEQEVVVDELLLHLLGHTGQGVVGALEVALEGSQGGVQLVLHLLVLHLGQAGVEGVSLHGATATHTGRDDELTGGVNIGQRLNITPVLVGVLGVLLETTMVVLDDGVEEVSERLQSTYVKVRAISSNRG
jgi:hypothetical protein